jgi:hypothetical protein
MSFASRYYQLVRLAPTGRSKVVELAIAKQCFFDLFPHITESEPLSETIIQKRLFDTIQEQNEGKQAAQLCLRCFISWQISGVCKSLERQFGYSHGFRRADLLVLVLDDDGKVSPASYQSLSWQILESFNPDRGSLSTWVNLRVKHHSELNSFLLERGVYLISDWAILNDTQPQQLERILMEFHYLSRSEIEQYQSLLKAYHRVYRQARLRDRIRLGTEGVTNPRSRTFNPRCQPPTLEQLQKIALHWDVQPFAAALVPEAILSPLQHLATLVRQYRIYIHSGSFPAESLDERPESGRSLGERLADPQSIAINETDEEAKQFLDLYRGLFLTCLRNAIATTIETRLQQFQHRQPEKQQQFLRALYLFHCQHQSMSAIAQQLGLQAQYQVTRLLNLKAFRADIRQRLLAELLQSVLEKAKIYSHPDRLKTLETAIEAALTEQIDRELEAAKIEASTAKQFTTHTSRFARQLCDFLDSS